MVVISCSPHIQSLIAVKALGIGKHVLCGSPAGPHGRDALQMLCASRYYPRLMSVVCHSLRFLPAVFRMRSLIDGGFIGRMHVCEVKVSMPCLICERVACAWNEAISPTNEGDQIRLKYVIVHLGQ